MQGCRVLKIAAKVVDVPAEGVNGTEAGEEGQGSAGKEKGSLCVRAREKRRTVRA